jgi:hypothetical protein
MKTSLVLSGAERSLIGKTIPFYAERTFSFPIYNGRLLFIYMLDVLLCGMDKDHFFWVGCPLSLLDGKTPFSLYCRWDAPLFFICLSTLCSYPRRPPPRMRRPSLID